MSARAGFVVCSASLIFGLALEGSAVAAQPLGGAQPQPQPTPQPTPQPIPPDAEPTPEPVTPLGTEAPTEPDPVPSEPPPAAPAAPVEEPAAEEEAPAMSGAYFRFDADRLGTQLWAGGNHPIGGFELATDARLAGSLGEAYVGANLTFGDFRLRPLLGMAFDFSTENAVHMSAPLIIGAYDGPMFLGEFWYQLVFASPFDDTAENYFYTRNFLLYKVSESFAVGPQMELTYILNQETEVRSLPLGGQLSVAYGANDRLSLFLGYDTEEKASGPNSDRVAGRITYVHRW